jgi:hypothetical protein
MTFETLVYSRLAPVEIVEIDCPPGAAVGVGVGVAVGVGVGLGVGVAAGVGAGVGGVDWDNDGAWTISVAILSVLPWPLVTFLKATWGL